MEIQVRSDKKLDEQNSEIKEIQSSFNNKFDKQSDKFDSFDIKFNELKNEIKIGHDNLVKKVDKVITKLDESLSLLETQKVNSTQKNEVLNNNVIKNYNVNNEFTDSKNITGSKNIMLENDNESIMNDNEVFECIESERKFGESIFVQGVQGVEFSFDVVLGGEEKSSRNFYKDKSSFNLYLGDDRSTNKVSWCFCVPNKWCNNFKIGTPAYLERESVTSVSYTHLDVYKRQMQLLTQI